MWGAHADREKDDLTCIADPLGRSGAHGVYKLYPAICDRDGIVLWLWIWVIRRG